MDLLNSLGPKTTNVVIYVDNANINVTRCVKSTYCSFASENAVFHSHLSCTGKLSYLTDEPLELLSGLFGIL